MRISGAGTWSSRSRLGFTLLELVVALFIIGILLLLIYPKLQTLTEDNLRTASRRLGGSIQRLYHEAVAQRKIHRLSFDLQAGEYRIDVEGAGGLMALDAPAAGSKRIRLPNGVRFQDVVTLRQGKVTEGEAFTHFYPVGMAEKTVIHLSDQDRRVSTLVVNPLTGRVQVYDGYVEVKDRRD